MVIFPFPICLPPVGVLLINYMQNISLLEGNSKLSTWYVQIFFWVIIKMGPHMNLQQTLRFSWHCPSTGLPIISSLLLLQANTPFHCVNENMHYRSPGAQYWIRVCPPQSIHVFGPVIMEELGMNRLSSRPDWQRMHLLVGKLHFYSSVFAVCWIKKMQYESSLPITSINRAIFLPKHEGMTPIFFISRGAQSEGENLVFAEGIYSISYRIVRVWAFRQ